MRDARTGSSGSLLKRFQKGVRTVQDICHEHDFKAHHTAGQSRQKEVGIYEPKIFAKILSSAVLNIYPAPIPLLVVLNIYAGADDFSGFSVFFFVFCLVGPPKCFC